MSNVVLDVSMSLDGLVAGPNVRAAEPMGDGGERLHEWMSGGGPRGDVDAGVHGGLEGEAGAALIGRRTFDVGLRPWGGTPWPGLPSFVITHRPQADLIGDNGGTFVFGGLPDLVERAKQAAGEKTVFVLGADVSRQLLSAGLVDVLRLHVVPLLLGDGTRLFDGQRAELIPDGAPLVGTVTHLNFQVGSG